MSIKGGDRMRANFYGLTNLQVFMTDDTDILNEFLLEYNGNIVDIQCTDKYFHVVYKYREDKQ